MKPIFIVIALACLGGLLPTIAAAQSNDVRIYRCTDAKGTQSLRDSPCPAGQKQQVRDMQRPKDAPSAVRPAPRQATPPPAPAAQVVYQAPPKPMYECTTSEGKHYTSDNGEGNPRWVPLWTLGEPYSGRPSRNDAGRGSFRPAPSVNASVGRPQLTLPASSLPSQPPSPRHERGDWATAGGGGTWIRDVCTMLPQAETCARQRDRRDEIRSRFFRAMPSERDVLRVEERSLNARLDNDCGGH